MDKFCFQAWPPPYNLLFRELIETPASTVHSLFNNLLARSNRVTPKRAKPKALLSRGPYFWPTDLLIPRLILGDIFKMQ